MAEIEYASDIVGTLDDSVRLVLGEDEVVLAESWDVRESILAQPASFTIRLGSGDVAAEIMRRYPPRTPFKLYIGGALQMSGRTDAVSASQSDGGATTIEIKGRDSLAIMHDSYVRSEKSFSSSSYADLVARGLNECGLDPARLKPSNDANRQIKTGIPIPSEGSATSTRTEDEIIAEKGIGSTLGAITEHRLQSRMNETWLSFVRRHIDRAGLFLWSTANGEFVLSRPNGNQPPKYRLVRRRGAPDYGANVISMQFRNDCTHRHSEVVIYGKGGGRRHGAVKSKGAFIDEEMTRIGYRQPLAFKDVNVQNGAEAEFFARRKLAEERREGWSLEYTIAGNTLPVDGGGRAVVATDTVVDVQDEELGIEGQFYIESVTRRRSPQTTTELRLMRTSDLLFGGEET